MGRAVAGPRVRLVSAVRVAAAVGAVVLVAGCGAADRAVAPVAMTGAPTTKAGTAPPTTAPATTPPPTSAAPTTPPSVAVPDVVGMTVARARATLTAAGLRWRTTVRRTSTAAPGTVIAQSPGGDRLGRPGSMVTLTVAQAPPPKPKPTPTPEPEPEPAGDCHPSYAGACLDPTASDYDCASGSGNGPKYTGRVTVVGPDVFDLDRDGDGIGCEQD
jgi:hypothetical protein